MIRREINIDWTDDNGEVTTYPVLIDMALIDRIEDDLNLMQMVVQLQKGDVKFTRVAKLIAILLNAGGCKVTQEQVFQAMFGAGNVTHEQVRYLLDEVFTAIFPSAGEDKRAKKKPA